MQHIVPYQIINKFVGLQLCADKTTAMKIIHYSCTFMFLNFKPALIHEWMSWAVIYIPHFLIV